MKKITNQPVVSVIIVYYKATNALLNCLHYLSLLTDATPFEVIIVDNNPRTNQPKNSQITFKNISIIIIQNSKNLGFGHANNIGAKLAKGKYLLFLNPDTLPKKGLIDKLVLFFKKHGQAGYVSPRQIHPNGKPYLIQGSKELTPLRAIFSESIIHKIWPNNPIAINYLLKDINLDQDQIVEAAPAGVCMIDKKSFDKIQGFDPNYFLFFEEHDLGQKLKKINKQIWLLSEPKVIHLGEQSTKLKDINTIFNESRHYYFSKYFGFVWAQLVTLICNINKWHLIVICLLLIYSVILLT